MRKRESVFRGKTRSTKANRRDRDKHPHRARKRETKHRGKTRQNRNRARHFRIGARHFTRRARQNGKAARQIGRRARQNGNRPRQNARHLAARSGQETAALIATATRLGFASGHTPHYSGRGGGIDPALPDRAARRIGATPRREGASGTVGAALRLVETRRFRTAACCAFGAADRTAMVNAHR